MMERFTWSEIEISFRRAHSDAKHRQYFRTVSTFGRFSSLGASIPCIVLARNSTKCLAVCMS